MWLTGTRYPLYNEWIEFSTPVQRFSTQASINEGTQADALHGEKMAEPISFDHVNLSTIDPTTAPFAKDTYTLMVNQAELKEFTYKKGDKAGTTDKYANFVFVITDSERYSGRKIFSRLFPNKGTLMQLRRIADATGIQQEPGEPLDQWMTNLKENRATFKAPVAQEDVKQSDGSTRKDLVANLWEVSVSA